MLNWIKHENKSSFFSKHFISLDMDIVIKLVARGTWTNENIHISEVENKVPSDLLMLICEKCNRKT